MGNLCSIFHLRFKNLIKVIPSVRKAQLVDYILLGWQTSTYTLTNSDNKWFMKPYTEIIEDTGIPKSTLERYIKELNEEGFIERRQALYSRKKEDGGFEVKKGNYIHITNKLIDLINHTVPVSEALKEDTIDVHKDQNKTNTEEKSNKGHFNSKCIIFDKNEGFEPLKMRGLYISNLYSSSFNNTISLKKSMHTVDNSTLEQLNKQYEAINNFVDAEIKEEISEEIKKLILGTFFNLTFVHKKHFSIPEQVVAEYLFSLINIQYCLPQVTDFKHRNNILAKMIRTKNWKTPKGFFRHFYLGQNFKDKQEIRQRLWQEEKEREMNPSNETGLVEQNEHLLHIEVQIVEKGTLIEELTQRLYQQKSEEQIVSIREKIQILKQELCALYDKQRDIENEIEQPLGIKLCA